MGFIQRRLVRGVIWVVTWPKVTLLVCAVVLVAAGVLAWTRLTLSTDQDELLTPKLKFFRDYKEFAARFPENESFVVILEPVSYAQPPAAGRWMALADRISAGLMALKGDVRRVHAKIDVGQLGERSLMAAPWEEVRSASRQAREFSQLVKVVGEKPGLDALVLGTNMTERFYKALSQGPGKDAAGLAGVVTRSLVRAVEGGEAGVDLTLADPRAATDPSMFGYNMIGNGLKRGTPAYDTEKMLVINVYPDRDYSSLAEVTEPLKRMRAVVAEAAKEFPEFKKPVITGRPALESDEMETSDKDTRVAEILGLSLVFVVLLVFLRNLWLVIVAEVCLGVGIAWTFGWATLSVGRLNLLSLVFVIALIGIGMDYLIQVLSRYRFEKRRRTRPQAVWARVFRYVSAPISTACAGAAGAFLVSVLTDFQGASELGIIAGGGLLLCLATGYTILPALLTLFPASVGQVPRHRRHFRLQHLPKAGGLRLLPALLWTGVSLAGLIVALPVRFDANLLKLQAQGLESVREVRKLPAWYAVIVSEDLEALRKARVAMMAPDQGATTIASTESVLDLMEKQEWLVKENGGLLDVKWSEPAAPTAGQLKVISAAAEGMVTAWGRQPEPPTDGELGDLKAAVGALQRELAKGDAAEVAARVGAWQNEFLAELRRNLAQFAPGPLAVDKLPESLREHLVSERDASGKPAGRRTYALYVKPTEDLWDAGKLAAFVHEVERRTPEGMMLTGIAHQLYHSTQMIHRAFLVATLYALGLIVLLVALDLRNFGQTVMAVSVLGLGLPMLLLLMWLWRQWGDPLGIPGSWNFANFFALPILIGAGHEYGVFMVHRYRETLADPRRVWRTWDVSDRALLLCGIVTSCSFGFLVRAEHRGLASLGWVMAVGTGCIYLATVLVLRPILQWRLKYKGVYEALKEWPLKGRG